MAQQAATIGEAILRGVLRGFRGGIVVSMVSMESWSRRKNGREPGRCPTSDKPEKSRGKPGEACCSMAVRLNEIFMEMAKAGANEECVCPQPNRDIHCSVHSFPIYGQCHAATDAATRK